MNRHALEACKKEKDSNVREINEIGASNYKEDSLKVAQDLPRIEDKLDAEDKIARRLRKVAISRRPLAYEKYQYKQESIEFIVHLTFN